MSQASKEFIVIDGELQPVYLDLDRSTLNSILKMLRYKVVDFEA